MQNDNDIEMVKDAKAIEDYCNQNFSSDRETEIMDARFYAKYGVSWLEVMQCCSESRSKSKH